MAFVSYLLKALAWATFLPWWLWVCWSIIDRSFESRYLAGVVLPVFLWTVYRTINKRVEAALTDEERLRRYHQSLDRGSRYIRAKARNQRRDNR
ncbi:MAG: hypothetical protein OXT71_10690 [Acidobacteriota bacterium]|nr:hypothetical protein [Acidobacteriota bacterium]